MLNFRGASDSEMACSIVCTCVSGNCGSMERTVAKHILHLRWIACRAQRDVAAVGNVKNDRPELIAPASATPE